MKLEIAFASRPHAIQLSIEMPAIPNVGDFVQILTVAGYVNRRRWTYSDPDSSGNREVTVRCWLQNDPPRS